MIDHIIIVIITALIKVQVSCRLLSVSGQGRLGEHFFTNLNESLVVSFSKFSNLILTFLNQPFKAFGSCA